MILTFEAGMNYTQIFTVFPHLLRHIPWNLHLFSQNI